MRGSRVTHKQKVLALLSDGRTHTHHELYGLGCVAHSRISDLRRDGHRIESWKSGGEYLYRLVGSLSDATSCAPVAGTPVAEVASLSEAAAGNDGIASSAVPLNSAAPGVQGVPQPSLPCRANGWDAGEGNEPVPGAVHPDQLAIV